MSNPTLKSKSQNPNINPSIAHQNSYNQLLNLKTTLLHLQYLYCNLSQRLLTQHKNQQLQHKDHLIQCFNVKEELYQVKKDNFMMLWIVKLEEMLAIEEQCNQRLLQNNNYLTNHNKPINNMNNPNNQTSTGSQSPWQPAWCNLSLLQKLHSFISLTQHEMQQSLCKLYIGSNVLIDFDKISSQLNKIESKIDKFLNINTNEIDKYNKGIVQFDQVRQGYLGYLKEVEQEVKDLVKSQMRRTEQIQIKSRRMNIENYEQKSNNYKIHHFKHKLYQKHVQNRLFIQKLDIQQRIKTKRQQLTMF